MKKTEITTTDELARLHKKVTEDLNAVSRVKSLLGGSCFTLNAEKRILALYELDEILLFHDTPEELNEYLAEPHEDEEMHPLICGYINYFLNQKDKKWSQPL